MLVGGTDVLTYVDSKISNIGNNSKTFGTSTSTLVDNVITLVAANKQLEDKIYIKIGFKELIDKTLLELYSKIGIFF